MHKKKVIVIFIMKYRYFRNSIGKLRSNVCGKAMNLRDHRSVNCCQWCIRQWALSSVITAVITMIANKVHTNTYKHLHNCNAFWSDMKSTFKFQLLTKLLHNTESMPRQITGLTFDTFGITLNLWIHKCNKQFGINVCNSGYNYVLQT